MVLRAPGFPASIHRPLPHSAEPVDGRLQVVRRRGCNWHHAARNSQQGQVKHEIWKIDENDKIETKGTAKYVPGPQIAPV